MVAIVSSVHHIEHPHYSFDRDKLQHSIGVDVFPNNFQIRRLVGSAVNDGEQLC